MTDWDWRTSITELVHASEAAARIASHQQPGPRPGVRGYPNTTNSH